MEIKSQVFEGGNLHVKAITDAGTAVTTMTFVFGTLHLQSSAISNQGQTSIRSCRCSSKEAKRLMSSADGTAYNTGLSLDTDHNIFWITTHSQRSAVSAIVKICRNGHTVHVYDGVLSYIAGRLCSVAVCGVFC